MNPKGINKQARGLGPALSLKALSAIGTLISSSLGPGSRQSMLCKAIFLLQIEIDGTFDSPGAPPTRRVLNSCVRGTPLRERSETNDKVTAAVAGSETSPWTKSSFIMSVVTIPRYVCNNGSRGR